VGVLCLLAALHVFIYSAALPFFNNVDEPAHFDTVVKYAHGEVPRRLEIYSAEMLRDVALYNSRFYFGTNHSRELLPPPWTWPAKQQAAWIAAESPASPGTNVESSQPPLYYTYAASWWRLGGRLGIGEGNRLYGLRFLNIPVVMLVVWLGWLAARHVFPEKPFRCLGVPAFIAVMPQSAFYAIQNDVLSPLFFGIAFLGLLRFWTASIPGPGLGLVTGLALAAAFLTKSTNIFPGITILVLLALLARHFSQSGRLRESLPSFFTLVVCAGLPALAWMTWCKINFGDLTGSQPKAQFWSWTPKPLLQWWHHPIFTPHGAAKFLDHFLPQFWQGELVWHLHPLSFRLADWIYTIATIGLLGFALVKMTLQPASVSRSQCQALWMSFSIFASAAAFLVFISIAFDFHDSPYPTPESPYLYCGRQALAALIPFMLLFVSGLDNLSERFPDRVKFIILGALLLLILSVEAASNWPAFADPYNWFHL
jgi:hypothetical protein